MKPPVPRMCRLKVLRICARDSFGLSCPVDPRADYRSPNPTHNSRLAAAASAAASAAAGCSDECPVTPELFGSLGELLIVKSTERVAWACADWSCGGPRTLKRPQQVQKAVANVALPCWRTERCRYAIQVDVSDHARSVWNEAGSTLCICCLVQMSGHQCLFTNQ